MLDVFNYPNSTDNKISRPNSLTKVRLTTNEMRGITSEGFKKIHLAYSICWDNKPFSNEATKVVVVLPLMGMSPQ